MDLTNIKENLKLSFAEYLSSVSSTQDIARQVEEPPPYLIVAGSQEKGRGRFGRYWLSAEGGLYFTLVIENLEPAWAVPLVVAYSVYVELRRVLISSALQYGLFLKWPNDIYHNSAKLVGVLVESWKNKLSIGVGINVNQEWKIGEYPVPATSLFMISGRKYSLSEFLAEVLPPIFTNMEALRKQGFTFFLDDVREALLAYGQPVQFKYKNQTFKATLYDITDNGDALVNLASGKRLKLPIMKVLGVN